MSAVSWDEVAVDLHAPIARPAGVGRPGARHLRAVPTGAGVRGVEAGAPTTSSEALRLTRRGRLALWLATLLLVAVAAVIGTRMAMAAPVAAAPVVASTVTVAAGETLSDIALREFPALPIREGMAQIRLANNMSTTAVSAGEQLVIPKL